MKQKAYIWNFLMCSLLTIQKGNIMWELLFPIVWQLQKQKIVLLSDCDFKRLGCTQMYSIYHAQMHVSKVNVELAAI